MIKVIITEEHPRGICAMCYCEIGERREGECSLCDRVRREGWKEEEEMRE